MSWEGGKGSRQRKTDKRKFDENFDKIFGKKENQDGRKTASGSDDVDSEVRQVKAVRV